MPAVKITSGKTGNQFTLNFKENPTQQDVDEALSRLEPEVVDSAPVATPKKYIPSGTFAPDRFTPTQLAAITLGGGSPISGLIASQLRGRPVTQAEAAAEAGLEEIAGLPSSIADITLKASPPAFAARSLESLGLIPKDATNRFIENLLKPATPRSIEESLGVEQGSERAFFRAPEGAFVGEVGAQFFPPVAAIPRAQRTLTRGAEAVGEAVSNVIPSFIAKPFERGLTTPVIEKATGLIPDVSAEKLTEVLTQARPRIIEAAGGKLPKNAKDLISAAKKAENISLNEAQDFLKQAEDGGFVMKGDFMQARGRAEVLKIYDSLSDQPKVLDEILSRPVFQKLTGEVSPTQGQKTLRELNTEYDRFLDKKSPEAVAYRAIRDELSDQLDDIVKLSSGKNIQPYRDFGNIREFRSGVEGRVESSRQIAGREAVPVAPRSELSVATTIGGQLGGAIARRAARLARPLIKQGQEFIDEAVESVIKGSPKKLKRDNLPEEQIAELKRNYVRRPTPIPDEAVVAPPIVPSGPAFEKQIAELIKTYPPTLRRDPAMARAAAMGQIQGAPPVP